MRYDPDRHHRRSIRLANYDYSRLAAYFVTICTQGRACLFGGLVDGEMRLNDAGRMVEYWWLALPEKFHPVTIDTYVVMPNHFHGIIIIDDDDRTASIDSNDVGATRCGRPQRGISVGSVGIDNNAFIVGNHTGLPLHNDSNVGDTFNDKPTLGDVVHWFKTMTTNQYIRSVKQRGWPPFLGKLWQRNYYEHIIRSEQDLEQIRQYIANNPLKWSLDRENPVNRK